MAQIRRYFKDLIAAVDFLHGVAGVVHRDIKPENIMLDACDTAKLVDFGVCLVLDGGSDLIEDTQGSQLFFAPEMCGEGGKFHAKKCDIWAAGVTLWKMVFDRHPFESTNSSTCLLVLQKA